MSVQAVQKVDNVSVNYPSYVISGGIIGYSLKWILPLTHQEKDKHFKSELKQTRVKINAARAEEVASIRNKLPHDEATDIFLKLYDENKLNESQLKKLSEPILDKVLSLRESVNHKAKEALITGRDNLITLTKKIRPTSIFILTGMGIGFATALTINEINSISSNKIDQNG